MGRATAEALSRKGANVAIGDIDAAHVKATSTELGANAVGLALDVTNRGSFARLLDQTEERLGPLDVLINNAGIMPLGPFTDETDQATERILAINTHAIITGSKLALNRMHPRGSGHIVNVASQAGRAGFGGLATYCASKYAVVGLCAALADELDGTGIEISCVMPAIVRTELSAGLAAPRLIKPVEPADVAPAIVDALERPRLNIHVHGWPLRSPPSACFHPAPGASSSAPSAPSAPRSAPTAQHGPHTRNARRGLGAEAAKSKFAGAFRPSATIAPLGRGYPATTGCRLETGAPRVKKSQQSTAPSAMQVSTVLGARTRISPNAGASGACRLLASDPAEAVVRGEPDRLRRGRRGDVSTDAAS
jgi:NAD(P)-dependent dehydrogenase (short-subunit alcohol dehydrogenase family)